MTIEQWWATERKRGGHTERMAQDPGYPMDNHDCLGRESPVPWSFTVGALGKHEGQDWEKCRAGLTAALRSKR